MKAETFPINVTPPPFFQDHHVQQRPVFPAVEAMERLAADIAERFPDCDTFRLSDLRFDKFLHLDSPTPIPAVNRMIRDDDGSIRTTLATRFTAPGVRISRTLEHATMTLGRRLPTVAPPNVETAATLTGVCTTVDPDRIYSQMVPFGPAYRNICADLFLSRDGALARVRSPHPGDPRTDLVLGSPYLLDAAFHAACVWCQRFCGHVAFPVSIAQRIVVHPTRLDQDYTARVVPKQTDGPPFVFDIFIYDHSGRLCEATGGVHMRDVSGGRTEPPEGFYHPPAPDPLAPLAKHVAAMLLLERNAVAPFARAALSDDERQRVERMMPKRARGFLSARLTLKRLSRLLSGNDDPRQSRDIETVADTGGRPQCPLADGTHPFCSVAHDPRFTIAVGAERPVGVDVEPSSPRALETMHLFMDAGEQATLERSPLKPADGALRVWSAKEAAAKALGLNLAQAWSQIRTTSVSEPLSRLETPEGKGMQARHAVVEGHLVTLLVAEDAP